MSRHLTSLCSSIDAAKLTVIWVKTEAAKEELKSHALIQQAATQNLLRAIDGVKPEQLLLKYLPGVTPEDFRLLYRLLLIEPTGADLSAEVPTVSPRSSAPSKESSVAPDPAAAQGTRHLALVMTRLVSTHLGLAGMALTTSIGKAATVEELRDLARQLVGQIEARNGERVAADALKALRGLL